MFPDTPQGTTHSWNDRCGEPAHNKPMSDFLAIVRNTYCRRNSWIFVVPAVVGAAPHIATACLEGKFVVASADVLLTIVIWGAVFPSAIWLIDHKK